MRWLFLAAAVLGTALPLYFLAPFVASNGLDLRLLFTELFQNNVSAFFGVDVMISAAALLAFVFHEGRRRGMKRLWIYALCTLLVGVSLGLPLFLFFREQRLRAEGAA